MKKQMLVLALLVALTQTACWEQANEGTVKVQTIYSKITRVIHGGESVWTWHTLGDEYFEVGLRSTTKEVPVGASTKDNAALQITIATTSHVIYNNDDEIMNYVRKFGLSDKERVERRDAILVGQINTETKNAISQFDAYSLLANQEAIQKGIFDRLKPIFAQQLHLELESVQIIGRPDFLDDRIEQAASAVVANQKLKEASLAALEAAKVDAEKKQVEAQTYANPALLEIRKLELQKEVAEAWSKHQGTLVLGGGVTPSIQIQDKK